jgi:hypothetical protein
VLDRHRRAVGAAAEDEVDAVVEGRRGLTPLGAAGPATSSCACA